MYEQRIHHENVARLVECADHAPDQSICKIHLVADSSARNSIAVRNTAQTSISLEEAQGSGMLRGDIKDQTSSFVEATTTLVGRDR